MKRYVINFFVWWFTVHSKAIIFRLSSRFVFIMDSTGTISMAQNINTPMFQDESPIGRTLGKFLRVMWVWLGGMLSILLILPISLFYLIYLSLPFIAISGLVINMFMIVI